ncbi:Uncharacterised protein [Klebsiella pneumoniae]|nr:Uncharacterised protein [Klebsiella pneumoniae]
MVRRMTAYSTPSARKIIDSWPNVTVSPKIGAAAERGRVSHLNITTPSDVRTTSTNKNHKWEISSQARVLNLS